MKLFLLSAAILISSALSAAEMITLDPHIIGLGGNVRGFGVLAEYPAGGPREIRLTRNSKNFAANATYFIGWPNLCILRAFDPNGKMVAYIDLGKEQMKQNQDYTLSIPEGAAGIWRFSVSNGSDDQYKISFPKTATWGIRGEMALGIGKLFPEKMYLYVPETAEQLIVEVFPWHRKIKLPVLCEDKDIADYGKQPNSRRFFTVIDKVPAGKVLCVETSKIANGGGVAIDGMPGLLCPTPEAALKLKGGLIEVGGSLLCGPIQAQARRYEMKMKPEDFKADFNIPKKVPAGLQNPQLECLMFGKYGSLGMLKRGCEGQITDPAKLQMGTSIAPDKHAALTNKRNFLQNKLGAYFASAALSSTVTTPAKINFAYHNKALVNRAVIAAFSNFVLMQGDDLLREGDFRTNNYPITHAFFAYDALAKGFANIQELLEPEAKDIWREAVIAIGDKCASYMAYQSNQWVDVIGAHLHVYAATGEVRFKRYFEILMNAYLDTHFSPASKHGQHPVGYFLEECGPDGNYDHLNMFSVIAIWHKYSEMKDADPALIAKLQRGIQKNLEFKKFFWVPGGGCPTALNHRTMGAISDPSWPGHFMARNDFDLAYTHQQMRKMPEKGSGFMTFSHQANTDEWAVRLMNAELSTGLKRWDGLGSHWTRDLYEAYSRPLKAKKVKLPYEAEHGLWTLPGFAAWKNAGIYGLIFANVPGSKGTLAGITSGGPLGLWNENLGWFLNGVRNPKKFADLKIDDVTWSAIAGTLPNGKFFVSGKEHNTLSAQNDAVEVIGTLTEKAGTVRWSYRLAGNGTEMTVHLENSTIENPVLLLPFKPDNAAGTTLEKRRFVYTKNEKKAYVLLPENVEAKLGKAENASATMLRIAFPSDKTLKIVFQLSE